MQAKKGSNVTKHRFWGCGAVALGPPSTNVIACPCVLTLPQERHSTPNDYIDCIDSNNKLPSNAVFCDHGDNLLSSDVQTGQWAGSEVRRLQQDFYPDVHLEGYELHSSSHSHDHRTPITFITDSQDNVVYSTVQDCDAIVYSTDILTFLPQFSGDSRAIIDNAHSDLFHVSLDKSRVHNAFQVQSDRLLQMCTTLVANTDSCFKFY